MGDLVSKPFQQWLASEIPLVAEMDTTKTERESSGDSKTKDLYSGTASAGTTPSQGTRNKSRRK
jgi:hypothetical protein